MTNFIGRKEELQRLDYIKGLDQASFIVIKGRRRIGKTRLLEEFGKKFRKTYFFSGLSPRAGITNQHQISEFINQFKRQISHVSIKENDWSNLFWQLAQQTRQGSTLIVLDEISWMGKYDPDFLGKLKNAWDLYFKKNNKLVLAVCASASYWIDKNLLSGTAFVGRVSLELTLEELPLKDCLLFWKKSAGMSAYNILKLLSITGGIPRYLEAIRSDWTAEENIKKLCFLKGGLLLNEFDIIFTDLFDKFSLEYKKILSILASGMKEQKEICTKLGRESGGFMSEYLENLIAAGFISREHSWHVKNAQLGKLSLYRLKDNYTRFYLKYIMPRKAKIDSGSLSNISLADLPGWYGMMGLQLENLVLSNRQLIQKELNINSSDIICDSPFFQRKTTKQKGCQIDYFIQTRLNSLYICEIKFSKNEIGVKVIDEIKEKIKKLKAPKNFSCLPVLIHANGVSEAVEDRQYFTKIINFIDLIKGEVQ